MTFSLPPWRLTPRLVSVLAVGCGAAALLYWYYGGPVKVDGTESAPTPAESAVQAGLVAALTVQAFFSHMVKGQMPARRQAAWVISWNLPALIFFAAMIAHGHKDPAVFAMAIAAVYVAAEHYVALRDQTAAMEKQVGNMENALGTKDAQRRLFEAYANPADPARADSRICAIQRYFDIDETWWTADPALAWDLYTTAKAGDPTLYQALVQGRRRKVLFVSAMSYPFQTADEDKVARQFGEFIGLVWYYVVLQKVKEAPGMRGIVTDYQIRIAQCANWIHVVDDTVFQIIGQPPRSILSRELTFNMNPQDAEERKTREGFVSWAIDDIERGAGRGIPAREYICSVLLRAGLNLRWKADDPLNRTAIDDALTQIGFGQWHECCHAAPQKYASCPEDYDITQAKALCMCIMLEFMHEFGGADVRKTALSREVQ